MGLLHSEERLARLVRHVRRGWERTRASAADRDRARRWLDEHPSAWPALDELWSRGLSGEGALASWFDGGAQPDAWRHEIPLHSVLASPLRLPQPMVEPGQVEPILSDAARLVGEGELVVFGSAALALWLRNAPSSRDVDLL
jgi:hypothetical protein